MNRTASAIPRLRVAAYCRVAGGEGPDPVLDAQRAYYEQRITANPGCMALRQPGGLRNEILSQFPYPSGRCLAGRHTRRGQ